ncbi:MAG: DNA-binding transcriptional MerR regulator [Gammaproteobacteria bacterium]|jgi:DNA-binding transcriptional MerR regulator
MDDRLRLYGAVELGNELGVTPRALRFYETKGLLTPRRARARRVYDYRDRARLDLILRGKRLGFSLADIRDYLQLYDADTSQRGQLQLLEQRVSIRIEDLEKQQIALERTLAELNDIRDQTRVAISQNAARPRGRDAALPQPSL